MELSIFLLIFAVVKITDMVWMFILGIVLGFFSGWKAHEMHVAEATKLNEVEEQIQPAIEEKPVKTVKKAPVKKNSKK